MSDSCDPMDYSLPSSPVHGVLQARYWSGLPFPPPGDLSRPGTEPRSPTLQQILYQLSYKGKKLGPRKSSTWNLRYFVNLS